MCQWSINYMGSDKVPVEYINVKMEMVIKHQDVINSMKKLGLKINKKNEKRYVDALKRKRLIATKEFTELDNDKEILLMYGLEFEN